MRHLLEREGVEIFTFDARAIKRVEEAHRRGDPGFEPLYGGSTRKLPWAAMGSDESRREYACGTAVTNEPLIAP